MKNNIILSTKKASNFKKLLAFGKTISSVCEKVNVAPITYGSLAYAAYTRDDDMVVSDIDFLIPESKFQEIIAELQKDKQFKNELTPFHTIKVYKDDLLIELDSIECYLKNVFADSAEFKINNNNFNILNIDSLIKMYKTGFEVSITSKKKEYLKKLNNLIKVKSN